MDGHQQVDIRYNYGRTYEEVSCYCYTAELDGLDWRMPAQILFHVLVNLGREAAQTPTSHHRVKIGSSSFTNFCDKPSSPLV